MTEECVVGWWDVLFVVTLVWWKVGTKYGPEVATSIQNMPLFLLTFSEQSRFSEKANLLQICIFEGIGELYRGGVNKKCL